jgi:MutS domain V
MSTGPTPPATASPREAYAGRLAALSSEHQGLARQQSHLSTGRRLFLGALVLLVILVEKEGPLPRIILIGSLALVLVILILRRARVVRSMRQSQWLAALYTQRLACVEERWAGTGEPATRYLKLDHPASADLDFFGEGSLFERLATPCTRAGEDTLAGWLLAPAGAAEVRDRQAAVAELRGRFDLRENLAYLASRVTAGSQLLHLVHWGQAVPALTSPGVTVLGTLTFSFTVAALVGGLLFNAGAVPLLIALGLQGILAVTLQPRTSAVLGPLEEDGCDLAALTRLFARLEQERFTASRLVRLQAELAGGPASRQVAWLHHLQRWIPLALALLSRPQIAMLLDRWRQRSGQTFGRWVAALGEIEALCALAAYSYECPDDPFPEILEAGTVFEAEAIGHPLLPQARCVRNDLSLSDGSTRVFIISGSNMAGKSTLLRAVGINAALALAGAPVRARRLRLAPLALGATLRIQDSLLAGRSRFQAEVLRIRQLLSMARGTPPLLFLLDELFQGTISADRRVGAEAILRQLVDGGAIGLMTTHDLALTDIAGRLSGRAANAHFEDHVDNGEMVFDYLMKPGVLHHTNGLALMRAVGIEV